MTDRIFLRGNVGKDPTEFVSNDGLLIAEFRIACSTRRQDPQGKWFDSETNWYNVKAYRQLASNVLVSVKGGQRVAVEGRLKLRDWNNGTKTGTSVIVEADFIGHDLMMGTSRWSRTAGSGSGDGPSGGAESGNALTGGMPDGRPGDGGGPAAGPADVGMDNDVEPTWATPLADRSGASGGPGGSGAPDGPDGSADVGGSSGVGDDDLADSALPVPF